MSESLPKRPDEDAAGAAMVPGPDGDHCGDTSPVDATTAPGRRSADTVAGDPSATGDLEDISNFPATVGLPSGAIATVDYVRGAVKRKAAAVLHTQVGDYEIEQELGRGGMGVVYKARHRQLRRDVALKMILSGRHAGPDQLERFLTEARAVAQLQHPNIVQIFDIGEHDGLPYFSLEFVDGHSLAQQLDKKPQAAEEAGRTLELLARAMQYAHDHGVLHRDLKPANVLLTKEGVPKITDFGLAKKIDDDESASTRTGTVMGTPSYMAPEQALGLTHEVGPAADQYSLGAILYEMLTGRPPFLAAKAVDTILQVIHDEPVQPRQLQPKIPVDLETICLKTLQKEPSKRYGSCLELAEDARRFREGVPIIARPVGQLERAVRWCRRNPRVAIPSISAVALLLVVAIVSTWSLITVSRQNVAIKKERDYATHQEKLAIHNAQLAKQAQGVAEVEAQNARKQEDIAKERAAAAKDQANLVTENMQLILDEVDAKLSQVPAVTETRLSMLESIVKAWDKIDASVRDDEEGTAVPTLMVARQKIAGVYVSLGKLDLADQEYRKLYDIAKHRITVKQGTDGARYNLAAVCNNLGDARQQVHRDMVRSREYFEEALGLIRDILQHPKPDPKLGGMKKYIVKLMLGDTLQNLGVSYLRSGQLQEASRYFEEALAEREKLLQFIKTDPEFAAEQEFRRRAVESFINISLDKSYLSEAEVLFRLGNTAAAEKLNLAAVQRRKEIFEAKPDDLTNKVEYARFSGHAGEFYMLTGRAAEGQPQLERAVVLLSEAANDNPKIVTIKDYLSFSHYRLGCLWDELSNPVEALEQFQRCRQLREEFGGQAKDSQKRQSQLMLALARCGDIEEAKKVADSLRATAKADAELLLEQARAMAQCSRASQTEDERKSLLDAAIGALQSAVDGGYSDPFKIKNEPDLKPLREDPRFSALIAKIAMREEAGPQTRD